MAGSGCINSDRLPQREAGPGPPRSRSGFETHPAHLEFRDGTIAGTIYALRIGGRIVEAYRGYGYGYSPLAPVLRNDPGFPPKR